ncbi:thiamine phosphate synthase [Pseudozobellia sp. WGM2]|uniref:thiamine phosphate synthase n=1 Tax=Pseudozobellia sp. WGM2 TaxID=2787625 RepID=UPI001ADEC8E5|nr:thiamine phosphate synthase [Pseudozobellia sp. WGM2]
MLMSFPYHLYLVISEESCGGRKITDVAEKAISGGVDIVQLREKHLTSKAFIENSLNLQEVLQKHNVPLIINDNIEVAKAIGAFGIHVGNNDMAPTEIKKSWKKSHCLGYSIEYLEQLETEETKVSDYLGVSPVFSTSTKTDTVTEWGLEGISKIRTLTTKPLVAIGSMKKENAYDVIKAGADCIAVVSAICQAKDPEQAAWELRNQIEKAL